MTISEFDTVITNFEDTHLTAFYKRGINLKLSDGITVINIYKPGMLKYSDQKYFKDCIIEISGNDKNRFNYQDLLKLQNAIEKGIDYLNKENENLIDRNNSSYEVIVKEPPEKRKTKAIKYADLEIGGIYKDNKENEWIFLGEADLYVNNTKNNRGGAANGYARYIYAPNISGLQNLGNNWFKSENSLSCTIDSYASKKRFFEKVGQLEIEPNKSITFFDEFSFYAVYGDLANDKFINEEKIKSLILEKKEKEKESLEKLDKKYLELFVKIMESDEKVNLSIDFKGRLANIKLNVGDQSEEFNLTIDSNFYFSFFYPVMNVIVSKNIGDLGSIDQIIKNNDDNNDIVNYVATSKDLNVSVKNINSSFAENIQESINNSISQYNSEVKGGCTI